MKFSVAEKCDLPVCEICEFSKAPYCPKQSLIMNEHVTHDGSLKIGDLHPGSTISVDNLNQDFWGVPLTPMVVLLQISLLVGVSLLTMHLDFSMLSISWFLCSGDYPSKTEF
jgi:hypothetical protein